MARRVKEAILKGERAPVASTVRRRMQAVRSRNTRPELRVRSLLHRLGYRYRLHRTDLPGKPDIVFSCRRKVILVHGCFWHGHTCAHGSRRPKRNAAYWNSKIEGNIERYHRQRQELLSAGWGVLTIWECEVRHIEARVPTLRRFLGPRRLS